MKQMNTFAAARRDQISLAQPDAAHALLRLSMEGILRRRL